MYCKKCGKEIPNDSKYCSFCGALQDSINVEQKANIQNSNQNESTNKNGLFVGMIVFVVIIIIFAVIVNAASNHNNSSQRQPVYSSSKVQDDSRPAKLSDLIINFRRVSHLFEEDDYYMDLQAQEKITNLKMSVDYKSSDGRILKTETLNIGKVVPGNDYEFYLSLNGMNPSDLDKISKFSYRIVTGTVIE